MFPVNFLSPKFVQIRKQSLVNQSTNPFVAVAQKLEQLPDDINEIMREQISDLTDPLIAWGAPDELMGLAKASSRNLYTELEPKERVDKINILVNCLRMRVIRVTIIVDGCNCISIISLFQLAKLRVALDSETSANVILTASNNDLSSMSPKLTSGSPMQLANVDSNIRSSVDTNLMLQTKGPTDSQRKSANSGGSNDSMRRAFMIGQSEERVQALSVVMLHLCTGLQYAQGVANQ